MSANTEILIAEDSPTQAAQLQHLLSEHGYAAVTAGNGREALEAVRRHKPTLVISDVLMPELDGYGLCKAIKSDGKLKDIPVILVTTLSDPQDVLRGLECGADNFIRKPYDEQYLLSRINHLLLNLALRKNHKMRMGMEIDLSGHKYFITSERQQILDLLISTYEQAVHINQELSSRDKELAHSNHVLNGLYRIAEGLNQANGEREVAELALERALELPGIQAGWISLREGDSGFRLAAARNLPPALEAPGAMDGDCQCRRQLIAGELNSVTNILECERLSKATGDTRGLHYHASVPLWLGNQTLGTMNLAGPGQGLFDEKELEVLYSVGNQVAMALERARLREHLERLVEERTAALTAEIAERKKAEQELRKLSSAVERTADSIFITDRSGVIEYVNPAFVEITGFEKEEALGNTPRIIKSDKHDQGFYKNLWEMISNGQVYRDVLINRKKDGRLYYEELTVTPVIDEHGVITHFISTGKDITERMQVQERMQYLAHHDLLTDLPNRSLLLDRMEHATRRASRNQRIVAVLFLDLDRFKLINDTLGHESGDSLLLEVSKRLQGCVRKEDTVSRLGGDEFVILLEEVSSVNSISAIAKKVIDVLHAPLVVDGNEFFITTSIGISLYPDDGTDGSALMRNADVAMYRAKEGGGNSYQFYTPDMNERVVARVTMEGILRRAWENREFQLHYQPQVDLANGSIVGVEALIRLPHPELGMIPPAEFIPHLEELGLIGPVGQWVLATACAQVKEWSGQRLPPIRCAVNLSARQFWQPGLAGQVAAVLEETGLDPQWLDLEITEGMVMRDTDSAARTLQGLKKLGVRISIDDFGTGYSSLNYLKRFPIDSLKIDRSFVKDITTNPDDAAIAAAIISLAHTLKIRVTAEGTETEGQIAFLHSKRCDEIQGYYFSKPLPAVDLVHVLRERKRLPIERLVRQGRQKTLLLVDDEPNILSALSRLLRQDGYRILTATRGLDGLELLATNEIGVILSDYRMPEMNGGEFFRRVKELYPETARIVLSGYTDLQAVTDAINRGTIYKFLSKPWEEAPLRAAVEEAFDYHKQMRGEKN